MNPKTGKTGAILPQVRVSENCPQREAGALFGGIADGRRVGPQPDLPLWPDVAPRKRVPLLDLVDAAGVPVMANGKGVPLQLRLIVRILASVRPADRHLLSIPLPLTVRELRDGLFGRSWRPSRDWPRLQRALFHARDYSIHDGRGRWFPLALRYMPDLPDHPDDIVLVEVAFPPGSSSGPTVDLPAMDKLSMESAPRWRAYIAAHSVAWAPGLTRVRAPRTGGRFVWTRNLAAYPILTREDRRRFAFGADKKHRTLAQIDAAFNDLPGLVIVTQTAFDPRTGEAGWQVLPAEAAQAVNRGGRSTGESERSTGESERSTGE